MATGKLVSALIPPELWDRVEAARDSGRGFSLTQLIVEAMRAKLDAIEGKAPPDPTIVAGELRTALRDVMRIAGAAVGDESPKVSRKGRRAG